MLHWTPNTSPNLVPSAIVGPSLPEFQGAPKGTAFLPPSSLPPSHLPPSLAADCGARRRRALSSAARRAALGGARARQAERGLGASMGVRRGWLPQLPRAATAWQAPRRSSPEVLREGGGGGASFVDS
ncbi:unnamed protein product [Prorocentrum cordatum]|uniref:Uncharacterized protein n=1 Tax=Prorocentrum cordatum TaxID=2364126 RepID=A0ABN9WG92_9DINO|nr:unnamed protein product [Polarella glacialis]